jgi:hypothetical protein
MIKTGSIKYPKMFLDVSKDIAYSRWLITTEIRNSKNEYQRGDKQHELDIETKGILGELVARHHLEVENIDYKPMPLVNEKPFKGADIVIGEHRIDVKASNNKNTLMVNEKAHLKGGGKIDFYWFIILEADCVARYFVYSYNQINNWEVKKMTYTNAYIKPIPESSVLFSNV